MIDVSGLAGEVWTWSNHQLDWRL